MSPLPRFTVTLMVGRELTLSLEARDPQAAEDIAQYLFRWYGPRAFYSDDEKVIDCLINVSEEGAR